MYAPVGWAPLRACTCNGLNWPDNWLSDFNEYSKAEERAKGIKQKKKVEERSASFKQAPEPVWNLVESRRPTLAQPVTEPILSSPVLMRTRSRNHLVSGMQPQAPIAFIQPHELCGIAVPIPAIRPQLRYCHLGQCGQKLIFLKLLLRLADGCTIQVSHERGSLWLLHGLGNLISPGG